mgnify:CR=1 FL=1
MYVYSEFSLLIRLEKSSCWLLRECFHLQELISEHLLLPPRHSGTFKPNLVEFQIDATIQIQIYYIFLLFLIPLLFPGTR